MHICPWQHIMRCSSHISLLSCSPQLEVSASDQFFIVLRVFSQVLSSYGAHEWYALMISYVVLKYFFFLIYGYYPDWAWEPLVAEFYVFVDVFHSFLLSVLPKTTPHTSLFSLYKESVLSPVLVLFLLLLLFCPHHSGRLQDMPSACLFPSVQSGMQRALSVWRCRSFFITDELSPII